MEKTGGGGDIGDRENEGGRERKREEERGASLVSVGTGGLYYKNFYGRN